MKLSTLISTFSLLLAALFWPIFGLPPSEVQPYNSTWRNCGSIGEVGTASRKAGRNYFRCGNSSDAVPNNGNNLFAPFDVYYNGTLKIELLAPVACPPPILERNATFSLGQMILPENNSIDRRAWENNPFSFSFYTDLSNCDPLFSNSRVCPPEFSATSSDPGYYWSQFWNTTVSKTNDGYSIDGNYTTYKYNGGNSWFLYTGNCTADSKRLYYGDDVAVVVDNMYMSGTVTPDKVDVTFTIASPAESIRPVFKFSGQHYKNSARLVTTGENPTTEGRLVYETPPPDTTNEKMMKMIKVIVSAVVGGIFLLVCACCCFCFCRRRRRRPPQMVPSQQDEVYLASLQQSKPPHYQPGPYEPYSGAPQGIQSSNVGRY